MKFRKDINGLRAIAVLPVLFFHAQLDLFSGGFLGVDVFFVISGYLITSLILSDLENKKFSFFSFYNRRMRRIFPALLLTSLVTTLFSFFFMLPYDLKNYGQSLVATMLSVNNILLFLTSGYWSLAAEFKPLYHTWSLAVEEQYYLLMPVILMLIFYYKNSRSKKLILTITILFFMSFTLSLTSKNQEFNFLIITHRMWELLAGSIVAVLKRKKSFTPNGILATLGLSIILISFIFPRLFSENQTLCNLMPVSGTMLIILFSSDDLPIGKLLSTRLLSVIGTISYSIYLFHTPILVFLRLSTEGRPDTIIQIAFVLLSIPIAYLSWNYVEKRFKTTEIISNKIFYSSCFSTIIILLGIGFALHKTYGFQTLSTKWSYGTNPQNFADEPYRFQLTKFTEENKKNILVIGNSFARDFINMLTENHVGEYSEIVYLPNIQKNIYLSKQLLKSSDITIAVSSHGMLGKIDEDHVKHSSIQLFDFISKHAAGKFFLLGTKNFGYNNNFILQKPLAKPFKYAVTPNQSSLKANQIEKKIWQGHYIDFIETISTSSNLVPMFTPQGKFISFDTEHSTRDGAIFLGQALINNTHLKELLR